MELDNVIIRAKDGVEALPQAMDAPSAGEVVRQLSEETVKKKRRRGKTKRKILTKVPWQNRRKNDISKRNNGVQKIVLRTTHAPYNNNQFLMEIHKPEPQNDFQILQTPTARTRDSSFSVDSEENNYFYSLPADEEEFLTKEFSSVYEDAQCERLAAMTKNELIQEYLLLEAKYDKLLCKLNEDKNTTDHDTTATDGESMSTDRETTATSIELSMAEDKDIQMQEIVQHMKDLEEQVREMKLENEKLRLETVHLRKQAYHSSSADSESDSSSTSASSSSSSTSSRNSSPEPTQLEALNGVVQQQVCENSMADVSENGIDAPLVNGYHNGSNTPKADDGQME